MIILLLYFSLAVGLSFVCSVLEAVMLSVSHAHIELLIDEGKKSGLMLRGLKERIDQPLSAILTVNTVANTVGAAGVGAQALSVFGSRWVALASGVLTFTILVFSEVIPKTLGAVYWKPLAAPAAFAIRGLIVVTFPFVLLLQAISRFIGSAGRRQTRVTREEMIALAGIGKDEGILHEKEQQIIENLLRLKHIRVGAVMTPRSVITAYPGSITVQEVMKRHGPLRFSRVPVYGESIDDVTGIVHRWSVLEAYSGGRAGVTLAELSSPVHAVPETKSVASALDEFIRRREHLFIVVDEYGGTEGLVSLEDAIETLLGVEIVDEFDSVEDMRLFALELWERRRKKLNL